MITFTYAQAFYSFLYALVGGGEQFNLRRAYGMCLDCEIDVLGFVAEMDRVAHRVA